MNNSDDEIFGRNIDQLDRETPRYNLSEDDTTSNEKTVNKKRNEEKLEKKMLLSSHKPPLSVASVPPYGRPSSKSSQSAVLSPASLKKNFMKDRADAVPPASAQQQQQPQLTTNKLQNYYPNVGMYKADPSSFNQPATNMNQFLAVNHQPIHGVRVPVPDIPSVVANTPMKPNNPLALTDHHRIRPGMVNPSAHAISTGARLPFARHPTNIHIHGNIVGNPDIIVNPTSRDILVNPTSRDIIVNPTSPNLSNQHMRPSSQMNINPNAALNQTKNHSMYPPSDHRGLKCCCPDCIPAGVSHMQQPPPINSCLQPQMTIQPERQRIEDEILLRQRELDSCWQEDELDCPRDFTAMDRKKEKCYAELNNEFISNSPWNHHPERTKLKDSNTKDGIRNREIKTSATPTSAMFTSLPREHEPAPPVNNTPTVKAKAKAVVSPFPRQMSATTTSQKKVNINTVVSQFSYSEQPEIAQDYSNPTWPQSEIGSRIPSSERINLSPLCMSAVPSGLQTPVEPGSGQRPLDQQDTCVSGHVTFENIDNKHTSSMSHDNRSIQREDTEKKKTNLLDNFRGNEQYKPPFNMAIQSAPDSIKNYTSSQWPQSEIGSRIPSSERISLSPLTMSGNPSGIQTPAEPNTGAIPLAKSEFFGVSRYEKDRGGVQPVRNDSPLSIRADSHVSNKSDAQSSITTSDAKKDAKNQVELPPDAIVNDNTQDFSQFPQSELTSRVPSSEMICLSPICQSKAPSARQSPTFVDKMKHENEEYRVQLRVKKDSANSNSEQLDELIGKMNLGSGPPGVPRFDYEEEDQIKHYGQPEASTRMHSYENLSFSAPWSANTSGIVTPCDHSSLYGGAKPLRHASGSITSDNIENVQASVHGHRNDDVHVDNSVDGVSPVDELEHSSTVKPHKELQRQNSWSSVGSSCSNRTDMSTVVNAPTSMHNTAPGSPDQDGSEVSDSEISESENIDANSELPASYSQPISPSLSTEGNLHLKNPNQASSRRPILRNANRNIESPLNSGGKVMSHQNDMKKHDNTNNPIKDFIEMAKEQFPKSNTLPHDEHAQNTFQNRPTHVPNNRIPNQQCKAVEERQERGIPLRQSDRHTRPGEEHLSHINNHSSGIHASHEHAPHEHQMLRNHAQDYSDIYPHHNERPNLHLYHNEQRGIRPHHGYQNFHPGGFDDERNVSLHRRGFLNSNPPFNYMPRPNQDHFSHPYDQNPYMNSQVSFGGAHTQYDQPPKHRMQSIPEGRPTQSFSQPRPQYHVNEMKQHFLLDEVYYNTHQAHMNQQSIDDQRNFFPGSYHVDGSKQENYEIPHPHASEAHDSHMKANLPPHQHRAYSITSLEPNRDSPPRSESLDTESVMSFASMAASNQNLDTKADMMTSLLSMLGTHDPDDMARTLLAMSSSPDSCAAMRQSGCLPLIIQLMHDDQEREINWGARQRAGMALHNIVHSNGSDRRGKREIRVLRLLEIIRTHSEAILAQKDDGYRSNRVAAPLKEHGPGPAVAAIMKLSFEEEHKNTICELGGLQTIGEILAVDFMENNACQDPYSIALRKYAGMVLINLTYNDSKNKAILCSMTSTLKAITGQLRLTDAEDLVQVFAGIIRNISWRPDDKTQKALQKVNAIRALLLSIQKLKTEVCIRTVLSAVWNLSAHNSQNKEEVCRTPGSLKYLAHALKHRSPTNSFDVVENAGGILRNVSSHIAVNMEYRRILRQEGCLQTLVAQLRSPSTHVISNSCGVLWNLSARCAEDQQLLWDLGAVSILKTLIHVKHKSISAGAASALRNLLAVTPGSGTDTESSISLQRSNSVPPSDRIRRMDKHYKSVGAADRRRKTKTPNSALNKRLNYTSTEEEPPPTYHDVFGPSLREMHHRQPSNSSQVFFPVESQNKLLPMNRLHKRFESTSSCSSFVHANDASHSSHPAPNAVKLDRSMNYCESISPSLQMARNEEKVMLHQRQHESLNAYQTLPQDIGFPSKHSNFMNSEDIGTTFLETSSPTDTTRDYTVDSIVSVQMDPYEDSPLSRTKDVVLMYAGTPNVNKKKKEKKKLTSKLLLKTQKSKKSSESILSSHDSLLSDNEKPLDVNVNKNESSNIWIKTKERILNKSHSSDLAFDKNVNPEFNKKSPFEFYSMSTFPNRVASDQCLSATERNIRDQFHGERDNHKGSWSSFNMSNTGRPERFSNQQGGNFTPNLSTRRDIVHPIDRTSGEYPYNFPENVFNQQQRQISMQMNSLPYLTTHSNTDTNGNPNTDNGESESKKGGKFKRISLLKNPLRKSSDSKSKKSQSDKAKTKDKK